MRRTSCKFFRRPLIWFFAKKSLSNKIEPIEILDRVKDFLITFNITMKKRRMKCHEMWHLLLMNFKSEYYDHDCNDFVVKKVTGRVRKRLALLLCLLSLFTLLKVLLTVEDFCNATHISKGFMRNSRTSVVIAILHCMQNYQNCKFKT